MGGEIDNAEIQRRLMVSQAIQNLRTKVQRMEDRVSSILGNANNPGGAQGQGDTIESSSSAIDADVVKAIIQTAFNDGFFTIQLHDHTGDETGGDAFAKKGSALL